MDFVVKQAEFEGPLDLLLQLVEKRKLFINDISLAGVTDDYLGHIGNLKVGIDEKTEFLGIAAILILLKTRSLLPNLELTDEEVGSVGELERRLAIFQVFTNAGASIREFIKNNLPLKLPAKRKRLKPIVFVHDEALNINSLHNEMLGILNRQPKKEVLQKVVIQKVLTIEEVIDSLHKRIANATSFMFSAFTKHHAHANARTKEVRVNIIVSFIAMLELVRQGILEVTQNELFDDIAINKNNHNKQYE